MKANELRIGNYIRGLAVSIPKLGINSDGTWQVTGFGIHRLEEQQNRGEKINYEPIPLTEEWLIKFGFTYNIISYYKDISYFPKRIFKTLCVHGSMGISIREGELDAPREKDVLITLWNVDIHGPLYVHKLQNVFHALTGEELTIKE